jgi:serpin B
MVDEWGLRLLNAPNDDPTGRKPPLTPSTTDVAASVRAFTADLYRRVADAPGNVVLSPYSAATALGMTLAGARAETAEQLSRVLHAGTSYGEDLGELSSHLMSAGEVDADVTVDLANSVWAQSGSNWEQQFLSALETQFKASLQQVDFGADPAGAVTMINSWVAERTHDKITELLSADMIEPLTWLVLINAAYFKAAWEKPFRDRTRDRRFTTADGTAIEVPTMSQTVRNVGHRTGSGWQALQLDFVGGRMAMALVLPDGSVSDLEAALDDDLLAQLVQPLDHVGSLQVLLPKWSFRLRQKLNGHLSELGMPIAFDRDRADFSGMTDEVPLAISTVIQEAFVAVDEEGAEAAAATGVAMVARAAMARPQTMIFDRPFLFLIFDRQTEVPLFIGRVSDPRQD